MEIQLTAEEAELVRELLGDYQRRLLVEISKADHLEFKKMLRNRENVLESLISKLALRAAG